MQKALKIATATAVLILYGMAVFHIYGMLSILDQSSFIQKSQTESVFFVDEYDTPGFALPAKSLTTVEAGGPGSVSNYLLQKYSAVLMKAAFQNLTGSFSRYVPAWLNISIGLKVSDIIFPFHYFW